ncbi:MAG: serine/threonine protein kinase [Pseudoruminococcus massiliensis]|jgi:predicted Ser/Thr protein kinase|uniref:serine/threonine protein kinase n=1 Tax=Pseudoruminococcus massiliensis TaxID=2086583 RepID=UPI003992E9EF|nr:protein kinase [Oscillospiraceae bacterium]
MNNTTQLNPNVNSTVINSEVGQETAINPNIVTATANLSAGTVLAGKYEIVEPLSASTGEADLYVCKYNGAEYIAKVYRRQRAVKPEVITVLKSIDSPYVAKLFDTGIYNDRPFEVLPYYKNGSLLGKKFSFDELKKTIIPCINEALRVLHQNDIIHKDLKPSNIMLLDDNKSVAIIDFGISSVVEEGNTVLVTKTGMTPEYSAPETFRNLFLEESDYYSFGITLYELYCGYTPYKNMNAEEIAQFTAVQRIPFPKDMPQELQDLISAVTYFDITNRNKKNNPNRRWTYTEVDNWCKGKKQVIPGEGTGFGAEKAIPPYTFLGQAYKDIPSLITALASNWNDGKKQLYRGLLSSFFKNFNPEIAGYCMDAEEEATRTAGKDDIIFWDLLYKIYPELNGFYWMGQTYESLPALGRDMLERLWRNDKSNYSYWDSILGNKLLTNYLSKVKSKNENLADAASALETAHNVGNRSKRDTIMNYYTMAYLLSGQKLFAIGEKRLKSVSELTAYMKGLLDSSYEEFEDFCHSMIDYDDTLDVQLEAWLIALGKRKELDAWRQGLQG